MNKNKFSAHIVQLRKDIKSGKEEIRFEWFQTKSFPCQWVVQVVSSSNSYPIGIMWTDFCIKNGVSINNIYVEENFRGIGLARKLINEIWSAWDKNTLNIIFTDSLNKYSKPAFQKIGFKQDKQLGWVLKRK